MAKNNYKKIAVLMPVLLLGVSANSADLVNPSNIPLATSGPEGAKPNLMFILDDSGSMAWDYTGDEVANGTKMCKSSTGSFTRACDASSNGYSGYDTPFMAYQFNKQFYNPNIVYDPPVNYDGTSFGSKTFSSAWLDPFVKKTTVNLTSNYNEIYWCKSTSPTTAQLTDPNSCRRNGINNGNPFNYVNNSYPDITYKNAVVRPSKPHYFEVLPEEFCDVNGNNCSSSKSASTPYPSYVRWCNSKTDATDTSGIPITGKFTNANGTFPKCQFSFDDSSSTTYTYPRFGLLQRVEVGSDQEVNFSNWFSYYRTRMNSMKTATSLAFQRLSDNKRIGFITINAGNTTEKFLPVGEFNAAQKQKFYTTLFGRVPSGSTYLREALSRVGRYYSGFKDGFMITGSGANKDPIQYSCQKNFALLSTDGYWNGSNGYDINGTNLGQVSNPDGTDSGWSKRSEGAYDGGLELNKPVGGSLSDVAMYYYSTPLRKLRPTNSDGVNVNTDNVPTTSDDKNSAMHMNTYTISLGLNGLMNYSKDYYTSGKNKDFENIKNGVVNGCSWTTGICNWPTPVADSASALDDVWHASVNGRGRYFSAQNPKDVVDGLNSALSNMDGQTSAAAAAATSSPNITQGEDSLFSSTYRTVSWYGDLMSYKINTTTGSVGTNSVWSAKELLQKKDITKRVVYFLDAKNKKVDDFTPEKIKSSAYSQYFDGKGSSLSQSIDGSLSGNSKAMANDSTNLINYLKGYTTFDKGVNSTDPLYRKREWILGDFVNSPATYVGKRRYKWTDSGYMAYNLEASAKQKMVYIGGNDGMLHAFNADTGEEVWALVPGQSMPNMYKLADYQYDQNHLNFVDGQITVMDAFIQNRWRTVLISGLGGGGKGYFALDITDPLKPSYLFEMCSDSNICSITDSDLGYTFGAPIITKRNYDGQWVAYMSNGYDSNNGKGIIYEVSLDTLTKRNISMPTSASYANQVGLSKINGYYPNFDSENKTDTLFAGGLNGNIYRVDVTKDSPAITTVGKAVDGSGVPQPITTKIELGKYKEQLILFVATGKYLSPVDNSSTQTQSVYGIKDGTIEYGTLRNRSDIVKQSVIPGATSMQGSTKTVDYSNDIGWMLDLTGKSGERVNVDPALAVGTLNILSNIPATSTCTAGGTAWYYQIDFTTGGALPDKPIATKLDGGLAVGQVIVKLSSGVLKNMITTSDGKTTGNEMYANAKDTGGKEREVEIIGWREIVKTGK